MENATEHWWIVRSADQTGWNTGTDKRQWAERQRPGTEDRQRFMQRVEGSSQRVDVACQPELKKVNCHNGKLEEMRMNFGPESRGRLGPRGRGMFMAVPGKDERAELTIPEEGRMQSRAGTGKNCAKE